MKTLSSKQKGPSHRSVSQQKNIPPSQSSPPVLVVPVEDPLPLRRGDPRSPLPPPAPPPAGGPVQVAAGVAGREQEAAVGVVGAEAAVVAAWAGVPTSNFITCSCRSKSFCCWVSGGGGRDQFALPLKLTSLLLNFSFVNSPWRGT